MNRLAAAALVTVCFLSLSAAAQEGDAPRTVLNTLSCEKMQTPLKVDVEIMDNAERFLRLKDKFVEKLRDGGAEIFTGAPLTLLLEVQTVREFEQREGGGLLEFRAGQESGEDIGREGDIFLRGNLWSNRDDSVLGGRKRDGGKLALNRLLVSASLNSRVDGRCLWQGEVRHELGDDDADEAAEKIMPYLATAVGKAIKNRPIDLAAAPPK